MDRGLVWSGLGRSGPVWSALVWYAMVWHGMVWYVWSGMSWSGLVWCGMVCSGIMLWSGMDPGGELPGHKVVPSPSKLLRLSTNLRSHNPTTRLYNTLQKHATIVTSKQMVFTITEPAWRPNGTWTTLGSI